MSSLRIPIIFDPRQRSHQPLRELHNGGWADYAECADRADMVLAAIGEPRPAKDWGLQPILRAHDADYVDFLRTAHGEWAATGREGDAIGYTWPVVGRRPLNLSRIDAKLGRFSYDAGTPITATTWDAAYASAQTALTALELLLDGTHPSAFALCRPPGHHAGRDYCGGYCYLNNAAIAAAHARERGRRVAILDIDYHHGNGTQDIFYEDGEVLFVSIHADPATDYPFFWGHADETGSGAGAGATINLPLPRGTAGLAYAAALEQALGAVRQHETDLLVLSFGADTFEGDPISHFKLKREDYPGLAQRIAALGIPVLIVMEGGYAVDALGHNVAAFLSGFAR